MLLPEQRHFFVATAVFIEFQSPERTPTLAQKYLVYHDSFDTCVHLPPRETNVFNLPLIIE